MDCSVVLYVIILTRFLTLVNYHIKLALKNIIISTRLYFERIS